MHITVVKCRYLVYHVITMDFGFALNSGETIVRTVHRSLASLLPTLALALVLTVAAAALAFGTARYPDHVPFPLFVSIALITVIAAIAMIVVYIGFFLYDTNVLVFTNQRLIEVEQLSLFNRRVSQLELTHVQDATGQTMGLLGTFLDYGDVVIQSAGEEEQFIFHYAARPMTLANDAIAARDECLRQLGAAAA